MRTINFAGVWAAVFAWAMTALGADVTISGLPVITAPSTNTFIEVADMDAATKSRKYLLTNLVTQAQLNAKAITNYFIGNGGGLTITTNVSGTNVSWTLTGNPSGGNMTNSGASVVGMFPAYTDTTGTLVTPTNALPLDTTIQGQTLTTVLTNKVAKAGDTMTGALTIQQGAATGLTVTNSASQVGLAVQGFAGQTSNLVTVASGGTNMFTVGNLGQTTVASSAASNLFNVTLGGSNVFTVFPQSLNLYTAWTDVNNWRRFYVTNTASRLTLGFDVLGLSNTGSRIASSGSLMFQSDSTDRWQITSGSLQPATDNSYDVGGSTVQARSIYAGTSFRGPLYSGGVDSATAGGTTVQGINGTGTDKAGGPLTLQGGQSTGTGTPGDLIFSTGLYTNATGSAANAYTKRAQYVARPFTVTNTTASAFQKFTMATNTYAGVKLFCTVFVRDASNDIQSKSSTVVVDAVNKTGTITATVSSVDNTTATSSGTLTVAYTVTDEGSNVFRVDCAATSSLTPTVAQIKWVVEAINSNGTITVTPQTN